MYLLMKILNKRRHVLKNLANNEKMVISSPDKDGGIVIIDIDTYNNRMLSLLKDNTMKK